MHSNDERLRLAYGASLAGSRRSSGARILSRKRCSLSRSDPAAKRFVSKCSIT